MEVLIIPVSALVLLESVTQHLGINYDIRVPKKAYSCRSMQPGNHENDDSLWDIYTVHCSLLALSDLVVSIELVFFLEASIAVVLWFVQGLCTVYIPGIIYSAVCKIECLCVYYSCCCVMLEGYVIVCNAISVIQ